MLLKLIAIMVLKLGCPRYSASVNSGETMHCTAAPNVLRALPEKEQLMKQNNVVPMRMTPIAAELSRIHGGYEARGMQDGMVVLYSYVQERLAKYKPSQLQPREMLAFCGVNWLNKYYKRTSLITRTETIDFDTLATDIIAACHAKGRHIDALERGMGVHLDEGGQDVVVNGKSVFRGATGTEVVDDGSADVHYSREDVLDLGPHDAIATKEDMSDVLGAFASLSWKMGSAVKLMLGWLFVATLSGALRYRPHVWVVGPAASGKTSLGLLLSWLLGKSGSSATGSLTRAGLSQELNDKAIGFIVDETEAEAAGGIKAVLEIARAAYSLQERDAGIIRGTSGGKAKYFRVRVAMCALGIHKPGLREADSGRWTPLQLAGNTQRGSLPRLFYDESYARELGRRVRTLAVKRWNVFQRALPEFETGIRRVGGGPRQQVSLGTLLAGYWSLTQSVPPTASDVDQLAGCDDIVSYLADRGDTDEQMCLDRFLSYRFAAPSVVQEQLGTRSVSMGNAVALMVKQPDARPCLDAPMQDLGIRVLQKDGAWKIAVAVSPSHRELARIFAGTVWRGGAWSEALHRLPGGEKGQARVSHRSIKVVMFDVPSELRELEVPSTPGIPS